MKQLQHLWDEMDRLEALRREVGIEGKEVKFVTIRKNPPSGERVRLFTTFGPTGWICNCKGPGGELGLYEVLASYPIARVRAWILKNYPEGVDTGTNVQ